MTATTWNPSDKSSGCTLSGSNLIATCNSGSDNQGVRGTVGYSSGQWYVEFNTMYFASVGGPGGVGIANLSDSLTEGTSGAYLNTDAASLTLGKTIQVGTAAKGSSGIVNDLTGSNVVGVAVDMTAGLVWFTTDGTHWNNGGTANPATGTGGYGLTSGTPMGTAYPKVWLRWGLSGSPYDHVTINGGTAGFTFTPPTGFTQWDGAAAPSGTWASTEAEDTFAGTGGILGGSWASTEAKDTFAGTGGWPYGPWASTEAKDAMTFVGYPELSGVWSSIEITDAMSAAGLGATTTFFDPATASPEIDFQSDKLTIINALSPGQLVGAKSNTSHSTGKAYAEFSTWLSANNSGVGIGNSSATFAGWGNGTAVGPGNGPAAAGAGIFSYSNGTIWMNGVEQTNWAGVTLFHSVVSIAIDFDAKLVWFRTNGGNWNGIAGADPAAGTHGYDISTISTSPFFLWAELVNQGDKVTLNAGASAFTYTAPSGFLAWDTAAVPAAPLALDGYATAEASEVVGGGPHFWIPITATEVTLSTTQADDVIVVGVVCGGYYNLSTVTSITDTAGLTWKKRNQRYQTGGYKSGSSTTVNQGLNIEIWWAHAPTALTGDVITINTNDPDTASADVEGNVLSGNGSVSVVAFGVSGANYTTPWDTHTQAGGYVDNFGTIYYFPAQSQLRTNAADSFLFGLHADTSADAGVTQEPWVYVASATGAEHDGYDSFVSLVYQVVEEPQIGTDVLVGKTFSGSPVYDAKSVMFDSIVAAGETGTDQEIYWYWDPSATSSVVQLTTGNSLTLGYTAVNFNLMVLLEVVIQSSSGLGEVSSISEGQGSLSSAGFERRSRTVTATPGGTLAVEIWWGWMPMYTEAERPNGDTIIINTTNTAAGDIIGAIMWGLGGSTGAYGLGDPFWDINPSIPAGNGSPTSSPPPYATDISTTIPSDLVVAWAANNTEPVQGFTDPFTTLVQDYPQTVLPNMFLSSIAPLFYTGFEFFYTPGLVTNETAEFLQSPGPTGWIVVADAIPVGPPQPPTGTMHISDQQDKFTHTGDYTEIGIASPGGWVALPAIHGIMAATDQEDINGGTPNLGYSPFLGEGWLGGVAAHAAWASVEHDDTMDFYGWVLGFGITGQMGAAETKDRLAFSHAATCTGTWHSTGSPDRWASAGLVLPPGHVRPPIPYKRRLLIVT